MTEPRTDAGRALLDLLYNEDDDAAFTAQQVIDAIRAVEIEAMEAQLERDMAKGEPVIFGGAKR